MASTRSQPISDPQGGRIPLIFGVTGHRDLLEPDRGALESAILAIFDEFSGSYPDTPHLVLSPLAEGADRLVAKIALDLGAQLVVPLPLPQEDYESDFADADSVGEFRALLARATRSFVIDRPPGESGGDLARPLAYERSGVFVARNCQVLIALWDGKATGKTGGTAEIVRFMREGIPAEFDPGRSPLDRPKVGPVYHISSRRKGQVQAGASPTPTARLGAIPPCEAHSRATLHRVCGLIDEFNRAAPSAGREEREKSRGHLLPPPDADAMPAGIKSLLGRYSTADTLAIHFQRRTRRGLVAILVAAFVVTSLLQWHIRLRYLSTLQRPIAWYAEPVVQIDVIPEDRKNEVWLARYDLLYLAAAATLFGLFWRARSGRWQRKHLDYRALAEGLRVQLYWRIAGLPDSAADHYLRKQRGELDWIRDAIRSGDILGSDALPGTSPDVDLARLRLVRDFWVVEQVRYFIGVPGVRPKARLGEGPMRILLRLLAGSDPAAGFSGSAQARQQDWKARAFKRLGNLLLYGFLPAFVVIRAFAPPLHGAVITLALATTVLVLLGLYARVMAFSEHAKQYGRMGLIFSEAEASLASQLASDPVDLARARTFLKELGEEALSENGDWVLLHRERPLELPRP